jgi:hypothetical protein
VLVKRQQLLEDVKRCLGATDKSSNASVDGFNSLWFDGSFVHSFNRKVCISVPTSLNIECAVEAETLTKLLSKYKAQDIDLLLEEGGLKYNLPKANGVIQLIDPKIADHVKGINLEDIAFKPIPTGMMDGIRLCHINKNMGRIKGTVVHGMAVMSTDTVSMYVYEFGGMADSFLLDDVCSEQLIRFQNDPVLYFVDDVWVHFRYEDGSIFSCVQKPLSSFPVGAFRSILESIMLEEVVWGGKIAPDMAEAANRVSIFSDKSLKSDKITVTVLPSKIVLSAESQSGKATEEVPFDTGIGGVAKFNISASVLNKGCLKCTDIAVMLNGRKPSVQFSADTFKMVVYVG